jgi:transposase
MIGQLPAGTRVYLCCEPIDLRKGFDGLSAYVAEKLGEDPYDGAIFIFRGKRADYVKIIYWDQSGMCLFAKRLEEGNFCWPPVAQQTVHMTPAQLALLLEGIDWRRTVARAPSVAIPIHL